LVKLDLIKEVSGVRGLSFTFNCTDKVIQGSRRLSDKEV